MNNQSQPPYANYPRGQSSGPGNGLWYSRPPAPYYDYITEAFQILTKGLAPFLVGTLIAFVLSYAIYFIGFLGFAMVAATASTGSKEISTTTGIVLVLGIFLSSLVSYAVIQCFILGMMRCAIKIMDTGACEFSDVFTGFKKFGSTFISYPLRMIFMMLGLLLLIVPGIYLMGRWFLYDCVMMEEDVSIVEAETRASQLAGSSALSYGLVFVLTSLVAGLGGLACGVGILFTYPILAIVPAMHYRDHRNMYGGPASYAPRVETAGPQL